MPLRAASCGLVWGVGGRTIELFPLWRKSDLRTQSRLYHLVAINAYWLGVSYMWNSLHVIILPILMLSYTESGKNTAYGLLTFLGLMVAMVVQPLSGALSDRTRHRLGRRRPWILLGTLIDMVWLLMMVLARRS